MLKKHHVEVSFLGHGHPLEVPKHKSYGQPIRCCTTRGWFHGRQDEHLLLSSEMEGMCAMSAKNLGWQKHG